MSRYFEGGRWHQSVGVGVDTSVEWTLTPHINCVVCGGEEKVTVLCDDIKRYIYENELVQDVWPDLRTEEREILISWRSKKADPDWNYHVCPKCLIQWEEE